MQFKDKLKERMNQKNIDTKEFAQLLYNYGSDSDLCKIPENKGTYKSHIRKVQKWLAGDSEPANIEELKKISYILDCDFSYLLGDSPIANLSNKKVAEWLGLDEIVISHIKGYDRRIKTFMSLLVRGNENESGFKDILLEIIEILLFHSDNSCNTDLIKVDTLSGEKEKIQGDDFINYLLFDTKNKMESVLYKTSLIGMKIGKIRREKKREEDALQQKEEINRIINECMEISGKSREEVLKEVFPEKYKK